MPHATLNASTPVTHSVAPMQTACMNHIRAWLHD
jgi:hypothetical protein